MNDAAAAGPRRRPPPTLVDPQARGEWLLQQPEAASLRDLTVRFGLPVYLDLDVFDLDAPDNVVVGLDRASVSIQGHWPEAAQRAAELLTRIFR